MTPTIPHYFLAHCSLKHTHSHTQNQKISASFTYPMKMVQATVFLLACLVISSSLLDSTMAGSSFCGSKCSVRCSKAGMKDRCIKYCQICCDKCKCVPSGTYGNKHECPCYRDLKNSKGKPKCP